MKRDDRYLILMHVLHGTPIIVRNITRSFLDSFPYLFSTLLLLYSAAYKYTAWCKFCICFRKLNCFVLTSTCLLYVVKDKKLYSLSPNKISVLFCSIIFTHFYIVKLGFIGVYIIFLISAKNHRLWILVSFFVSSFRFRMLQFHVIKQISSWKNGVRDVDPSWVSSFHLFFLVIGRSFDDLQEIR